MLDVRDDNINALNGHPVKLKRFRIETVVRDYDICKLFGRLDVLFESRLGLVLIGF